MPNIKHPNHVPIYTLIMCHILHKPCTKDVPHMPYHSDMSQACTKRFVSSIFHNIKPCTKYVSQVCSIIIKICLLQCNITSMNHVPRICLKHVPKSQRYPSNYIPKIFHNITNTCLNAYTKDIPQP